jgi:hypothetical protein
MATTTTLRSSDSVSRGTAHRLASRPFSSRGASTWRGYGGRAADPAAPARPAARVRGTEQPRPSPVEGPGVGAERRWAGGGAVWGGHSRIASTEMLLPFFCWSVAICWKCKALCTQVKG